MTLMQQNASVVPGKTLYGRIRIEVLNSAVVRFQHGTSGCVRTKKQSHKGVFPQQVCYLLANSCLNTTQAPIKIPKTKNYNSRRYNAKHFEKLFVKFVLHECGE